MQISKTIDIAEVVVPASQIILTPVDLTVFFSGNEVSGIRMTLIGGAEPQHIELKSGDKQWTDSLKVKIEELCANITSLDTAEQVGIVEAAKETAKASVQVAEQFRADVEAGLKEEDGTLTKKGEDARKALMPIK